MTSEQYPGFPPDGVPNGVPPQTPNGVPPQASGPAPSAFSNQPAAPQNQPVTPNGPVYQVPPGYVAANGQLAAAPVTKSRQGLVIGISTVSLVLVLAVVLFILLFTGVLSLPGGSKAAGGSASAPPDDVISGLTQSEKEPELIDMGNDPGKFYAFIGDTLLATDGDEVWAFSLKSQKEVWRSDDAIKALNCDSEYDALFAYQAESNSNLALMSCSSDTTTHYAVISAKDGKVVTKKELNSDEVSSFMEILKDGSLVTCENNELIHYAGVASTEKKLWNQPVKDCKYYFSFELGSGWIKTLRDGPWVGGWSHFWGDLFNLQDGSQPPAARAFADTIEDLDEDAYSFTPLENGNFAVEYYTKAGEDEDSKGHVVLVDAKGKTISQTYDDAFITSTSETGVVLVAINDSKDSDKLKKNIRLDPATGQELWTNQDAKLGAIVGADKQFIWGLCTVHNEEDRTAVLDANTGKTVTLEGLDDAPWVHRTENGLITEVDSDTETKLKAHVWKDGKFTELWSKTFKNVSYFADYQHRLYAISNSSDGGKGGIVGYLGYESAN